MDILEILDREGLELAKNDKRIFAFIIDELIISFLVFVALYDKISTLNNNTEQIIALMSSALFYIIVVKILYYSIFTALYGASIGKILCKIKIVKLDTLDKPNIVESVLRSTLRVLAEFLFYIPFLFAFVNPFRQALHDMMIRTIVIDVSIPQDLQD